MKKILIASLVFLSPLIAKADPTSDLITSTLLDHMTTVTQFKSGQTKLAMLDSVVLIGSVSGRSILDLQLGVSGNTVPEAGQPGAANLVASGFFKISSLIKDKTAFGANWKFLNSIEHGVAYTYDFRTHSGYASYQVGLAFTLNPLD